MSTVEQSRIKLMKAILDEIPVSGYKSASTKKIADRAGMNEASIFRLFGSKDQLFIDAMFYFTINADDIDMSLVLCKRTFKTRLRVLLESCFELYLKQIYIFRSIMFSLIEVAPWSVLYNRIQDVMNVFSEFLENEYLKGTICHTDFNLFTEIIFSQIFVDSIDIASNNNSLKQKEKSIKKITEYINENLKI